MNKNLPITKDNLKAILKEIREEELNGKLIQLTELLNRLESLTNSKPKKQL